MSVQFSTNGLSAMADDASAQYMGAAAAAQAHPMGFAKAVQPLAAASPYARAIPGGAMTAAAAFQQMMLQLQHTNAAAAQPLPQQVQPKPKVSLGVSAGAKHFEALDETGAPATKKRKANEQEDAAMNAAGAPPVVAAAVAPLANAALQQPVPPINGIGEYPLADIVTRQSASRQTFHGMQRGINGVCGF